MQAKDLSTLAAGALSNSVFNSNFSLSFLRDRNLVRNVNFRQIATVADALLKPMVNTHKGMKMLLWHE